MHHRFSIFLFSIVVCLFCASCSKRVRIPLSDVELSASVFDQSAEEVKEAYSRYWTQVQHSSASIESFADYAQFLHANGFYEKAMKAYEALVNANSSNYRWYYLQARIKQDYGLLDESVILLKKAAELNPSYLQIYVRLGDLFVKTGQQDLAVDAYAKTLSGRSTRAYGYLGLGRIALEKKDWDQAEQYLSKSIARDKTLSTAHILLASVLEQKGESISAEKERKIGGDLGRFREVDDPLLDDAFQHCFDLYRIHVIADAFQLTGQYDKTVETLEWALSISPDDVQTMRELALAHLEVGNFVDGIPLITRSIQLDPSNPDGYSAFVSVLIGDERWDEALRYILEGNQNNPNNVDLLQLLGIVLEKKGDSERALKAYEKALALSPSDLKTNLILARYFWSRENAERSVPFLIECCRLDVTAWEPREMLAKFYLAEENLTEAEVVIEELLRIDSAASNFKEVVVHFFAQKGMMAFRAGELKLAEKAFLSAIHIDPAHRGILSNLLILYRETKQLETAKFLFNELVDKNPSDSVLREILAHTYLDLKLPEQALDQLQRGYRISLEKNDLEQMETLKNLIYQVEKRGF